MGVALVTKRVVSYVTVEEEQGNAVFAIHFAVKAFLTSCTLLTKKRWRLLLRG